LNHLVIFTPKNAKRPIQQFDVCAETLWAKLVEFITLAGSKACLTLAKLAAKVPDLQR
jgi:hypothetical protein